MKTNPHDIYSSVIELSNDLSKLVEVGTLYFINLPCEVSDLSGIPTSPRSRWKWLDIELFLLRCQHWRKLHSVIHKLKFLIMNRYAMATFKMVRFAGQPICVVRVYAVPSDIEGFRFLAQWRNKKSRSLNLDKNAKKSWLQLIPLMDFSPGGWFATTTGSTIITLICCDDESSNTIKDNAGNQEWINFHLKRWALAQSHRRFVKPVVKSVQDQIMDIYNNIPSPDVMSFLNSSNNTNSDFGKSLVRLLDQKTIEGVKSQLYPFQLNSLAKMYQMEIYPSYETVPNFIELKSPTNRKFYFDHGVFWNKPDTYKLPKGGILAENMGLGKTLICLALICYTKHEISVIPDEFLHFQTSTTTDCSLETLQQLCIREINQNSLPWKKYAKNISESIIQKLIANPGTFKIGLTESNITGKVQTRNRASRAQLYSNQVNVEGITSKTLLLCNTTLILVPDNLFHQWNNELKKHIYDHALKKLFISKQFTKLHEINDSIYTNKVPTSANYLIGFDLIICSQSFIENANSVFKRIYWKRVIIDEGHSTSSKNSRLSNLCREIYAERRWAVTGTPTSGLTKLDMNEKSNTTKTKYSIKKSITERDDLSKLGSIIGNFLHIEFFANTKFWNTMVSKPLINKEYGADRNLSLLLSRIVVRHSLDAIDSDMQLPTLHHKPVFLKPSYHNKLALNLFTAVLAVNAVSSERTDVDYMFHPSNRPQLRRLVDNLQRSTFYWTGFKQSDVESLISIIKTCLTKSYSEADRQLLLTSLEVAQTALNNSTWRAMALLHEMAYFVQGLPSAFSKNFAYSTANNLAVFGAPHIVAIQDFFYKHRFSPDKLQQNLDESAKKFWENYWNDDIRRISQKFKHGNIGSDDVLNAVNSPSRKRSREDNTSISDTIRVPTPETEYSYSFDSMREAKIVGSGSAKLSYITARLLEHQFEEVKSIVFFDYEDSAYYLTESLDLLGVDYILYVTFIKPAQRVANLTEFSNHKGGITLIMDLKLASHGLNIIAATRVYFLSPVWSRSVEAQAIKRAHRIGQTKQVYVETLLLEGTLEEEIYKRRTQDDGKSDEKKYVIDDFGMQSYILKHQFLDMKENENEFASYCDTAESNRLINTTNYDKMALLNHKDFIIDNQRFWDVKLFSNQNLCKTSMIKHQKVRESFLESELIRHLIDPDSSRNDEESSNQREDLTIKQRKRVRF